MSLWRTVVAGVRRLARNEQIGRDLADELRHFAELATEENVRRGMSRDAAERAARLEMGGVEATKAEVRAGGWEAHVEAFWNDVRYAWRGLWRAPAFTAVTVLTLALGVGANTAMFSVVNAVTLRPLPYRDADRLALVWTDDARRGLHREATALATIEDWRARARSFADVAHVMTQRVSPIRDDGTGERVRSRAAFVSGNLFATLGTSPAVGRVISAEDERTRAPVAVISHAFWQRWFGGARDVVGRPFTIDDGSRRGTTLLTVIGVMPADFFFPDRLTEIWIPATTYWQIDRERGERFQPWARHWIAVGRLAPGAVIDEARADLNRVGRALAAAHPITVPEFPGFATAVVPMLDTVASVELQSALWLLLGAVALVLLIACANVASLILGRSAARHREFAVRAALGAARGRLIRQVVAESLTLAAIGGVAGALIAAAGTRLLARAAAQFLPRLDQLSFDLRVLGFAIVASLISAIAFGIAPALRLSAANASEALREAAHVTAGRRLRRSRGLLVAGECALAVVLLAGAGLLLKSLYRLHAVDPGFDPRNVLAIRIELPSEPPPTGAELAHPETVAPSRARVWEQRMHDLVGRVEATPGVESASFIDDLFISGSGNESVSIPGRPPSEVPPGELAESLVSPELFATLRVPLLQGRFPTRDDAWQKIRALQEPDTPEPVVVNDAFVRRYFPGENPIGKRFYIDPNGRPHWYVVIGVVAGIRRQGLHREVIPQYYGPVLSTSSSRVDLLVRTSGPPLELAATIRREVSRFMPGVSIASVSTVESQLGEFSGQRRLQTWLLSAFAALAVILAAIGIFGLVHHTVSERAREIAIRVSLGASPRAVMRMVIVQGLRMPVAGILIGTAASFGVTRLLSDLLFGVAATDPLTFAAVVSALIGVGWMACYLGGRRAARLDPITVLRES
jgi:predicted permease